MSRLLTPQEVADRLAVSTDTVQRMAARGELPGLRVGRQWRFSAQAVSDWLAARQRAHINAGGGGSPSPAEMPASGERLGTLVSVRSLPRDEYPSGYQRVYGDDGAPVAASPAAGRTRSARTTRKPA